MSDTSRECLTLHNSESNVTVTIECDGPDFNVSITTGKSQGSMRLLATLVEASRLFDIVSGYEESVKKEAANV